MNSITEVIEVGDLVIYKMPNGTQLNYKGEVMDIPFGILDYEIGDLEGDGNLDIAIIFKRRFSSFGGNVKIFSLEDSLNLCFDSNLERLNPWKVKFGDVDGDGIEEISFGVYTIAPFHQVYSKRLFLYNLNKETGKFRPKFRASRLSSPYHDFTFVEDENNRDLLLAIEELEDGSLIVKGYTWRNFGFYVSHESINFVKDNKWIEDEDLHIGNEIFSPEKELRRLE